MKQKTFVVLFSVVLFLGLACEKTSEDPVFDLTPKIELLDLSSETLVQFKDNLNIRINYEDGDGDIGNDDPDINSLFVKDARLEKEDGYYVAPVAPAGAEISITGTLKLVLEKTFILGNADQEKTTFTILPY